jgi:hypothetical protein
MQGLSSHVELMFLHPTSEQTDRARADPLRVIVKATAATVVLNIASSLCGPGRIAPAPDVGPPLPARLIIPAK